MLHIKIIDIKYNKISIEKAERFIFASSEWVYPESDNTNFNEKKVY